MRQFEMHPGLTYLNISSIKSLQTSLETLSGNQRLNIYIENSNYDYNKDPMSLESVTVAECMNLMKDYRFDTSTYMFPGDLSWCLATAEDYPLLLGVKGKATEETVGLFTMELFEVNYQEILYPA